MNGIQIPNDPAGIFYAIPMPGVAWAGQNPLGEGFCFGLESGGLVLTDTQGTPQGSPGGADSKEAINGLAFSKGWLAVTTSGRSTRRGTLRVPTGRARYAHDGRAAILFQPLRHCNATRERS